MMIQRQSEFGFLICQIYLILILHQLHSVVVHTARHSETASHLMELESTLMAEALSTYGTSVMEVHPQKKTLPILIVQKEHTLLLLLSSIMKERVIHVLQLQQLLHYLSMQHQKLIVAYYQQLATLMKS